MTPKHRIAEKMDSCRPYRDAVLRLKTARATRELTPDEWSSLERNLQLVLECALDVGDMLISWRRLRRAQKNREVFLILGEEGIIDPDLAKRLEPAASLRNLLVHGYAEIDRERLITALHKDIHDVDDFAAQVARFVERS